MLETKVPSLNVLFSDDANILLFSSRQNIHLVSAPIGPRAHAMRSLSVMVSVGPVALDAAKRTNVNTDANETT